MNVYDQQYIAGTWRTGCGHTTLENRNPYNNELLYTYTSASAEDIQDACAAAAEAAKSWRQVGPAERVNWLEKLLTAIVANVDELRAVLIEEGGSAPPKVGFEIGTIQQIVKEAMSMPAHMAGGILPSDIPGKMNLVLREPRGVVAVIAPWNVPFVLAMRSVVPAIATGNTVVLKPSSDTPASALWIAKCFDDAGFPPGVFNVVCGKGSEMGDHLITDPRINAVSFTGSTAVGRHIGALATEAIKDVSLELGGNNVMIVLPDADLTAAARAAAFGAHFHAGQICMAINRIIVLDDVHDAFVDAYIEAVQTLPVGDPAAPNTFIGPIINGTQADKVEQYVQDSVAQGATVALAGHREGNLISPWILTGVHNDMPTACNEVFGPVTSILRATDEDEAIAIANDTEYGLSGSVFSGDRFHGFEVARRIESGMVHVNDQSINDEPHVVFGGEKASGLGRFNGKWVADKFTRERWISIQDTPRPF